MNGLIEIMDIARRQAGYFSAKQAISAGVPSSSVRYYAKQHQWKKYGKGIYCIEKLNDISEFENCYPVSLWFENKQGNSEAVFSSLTALGLWELTDVFTSSSIYVIVPESYRRTAQKVKRTVIKKEILADKDFTHINGLKVVRPWLAIRDCIDQRACSPEFVEKAFIAACLKGIISPSEVDRLISSVPASYQPIIKHWQLQADAVSPSN